MSVTPATINEEIGLLSAAINYAWREWDWECPNPVPGRRLKAPPDAGVGLSMAINMDQPRRGHGVVKGGSSRIPGTAFGRFYPPDTKSH